MNFWLSLLLSSGGGLGVKHLLSSKTNCWPQSEVQSFSRLMQEKHSEWRALLRTLQSNQSWEMFVASR